ncbi:MAG: GNAT family N-acetyltransferase [Solirubrobacteraceae bacterium]
MLWALSRLRLEHPWWSYAEVLLAGAVLVWWALGYRKAAGVFGLVMLARFGLSLVFKAHETAVGIGYWTAPETQGKGLATRAVRLLSRWALHHAEVIRIEALLDPCTVAPRRVGENQRLSTGRAASALPRVQRPPCRRARILAAAIRYLTAPIGRELRAPASRPSRSVTETSARGEKEARSSDPPARRSTPAFAARAPPLVGACFRSFWKRSGRLPTS